jgi:hypothetical protein
MIWATTRTFTSSRGGRAGHEGNYRWSAVMMKSRQSGLPSHAFYPVALKMSCSTVLLSYLHQQNARRRGCGTFVTALLVVCLLVLSTRSF